MPTEARLENATQRSGRKTKTGSAQFQPTWRPTAANAILVASGNQGKRKQQKTDQVSGECSGILSILLLDSLKVREHDPAIGALFGDSQVGFSICVYIVDRISKGTQ